MLYTALVGMELLECLAHQPAKILCVKEAACSAPVGLCLQPAVWIDWAGGASLTISGRQSCVVLPILGWQADW